MPRITDYDYSLEGSYFVTLCTQNRARLFQMEPVGNGLCAVPQGLCAVPQGLCAVPANQIIHKWVKETENKYPNIAIDKYVIMPDHLHFIITIKEQHTGCSLPTIMVFFKTMTTNAYIRGVKEGTLIPFYRKLWQKSYYDHVIRNQQDYNEIWEYIENNPTKWLLIHNENI